MLTNEANVPLILGGMAGLCMLMVVAITVIGIRALMDGRDFIWECSWQFPAFIYPQIEAVTTGCVRAGDTIRTIRRRAGVLLQQAPASFRSRTYPPDPVHLRIASLRRGGLHARVRTPLGAMTLFAFRQIRATSPTLRRAPRPPYRAVAARAPRPPRVPAPMLRSAA